MDNPSNKLAYNTCGSGSPMTPQRPLTVGENITQQIEATHNQLQELYRVRDQAKRLGLWHLTQQDLGKMVYPGGAF